MDKARELFEKLPPWGWALLVLGLIVVASKLRSPSVRPVPTIASHDSGSKVTEGDIARAMNETYQALGMKLEEKDLKYREALAEQQSMFVEGLSKVSQGFNERVSGLTSTFAEQQASLANQLGNVTNTFNQQRTEDMNFLQQQLSQQQTRTLNLGYGAYNMNDPAQVALRNQDLQRLKNDSTFVVKEIERATQVINDRLLVGLDVSLQKSYLEKLQTGYYSG